ncbi:MAG: hypothetical protein QCH35_08605 [Methanomicrobiaceae archaeon]|nr:hypothetical protein [Methanomicrobiaceae archaeon]
MIRGRAIEAVRYILESAGYEVGEVDGEIDLSAMNENTCIVVLCSDDGDAIETFETTRYSADLDAGRNECAKILVTSVPGASSGRCERWGIADVARLTGEAMSAALRGEPFALDLEAGRAESAREEAGGASIPHLPITVDKSRAARIAGIDGQITFRFLPHWHYHWTSTGEKIFKDRVISFDAEERGCMSAINGLKSDIDIGALVTESIPGDAIVLDPTIDEESARNQIIEEITDKLTRGVRVKREEGDTISTEDKILKPDRKDLAVDLTLFYIPVWHIKGKKIVEVNAVNGEILSQPMDDGVELI